ncbi:MAG: ABC transporter substrate-binding protein [Chloroflexota bacterium]
MRSFRTSRRAWLRLAAGVTGALALTRLAPPAEASVERAPLAPRRAASAAAPAAYSVAAQGGGILRVADPFGAPSLDPIDAVTSYIIQYGLGEALVRITPQGTVEPWLAESVMPIDPVRWRVRLRSGITFSNGRPIDAEAVRSSTLRVVERRKATANLLDLASVEVVDGLTFDMVTRAPNGAFMASLGGANLIVHDADAAVAMGDAAFAAAPVLTGPMIPTTFTPRELVVTRRNDTYWQGVPALSGTSHRAVSDGNARLAAVLAGDVDLARQIPVQGVGQARGAGLTVASGDEQAMNQIYFNCRAAPFDEVAVRQAVSLAINRDALVVNVVEGSGSAATSVYPAFFPFADPTPYPYNPTHAGALLDAAGWTLGSDGMRSRGGQPLAFELLTYPQRPELGLLATVIQSELAQIGMTATIRNVEQITPIVNNREYVATMYRLGTAPTADPGFILNQAYASWGVDNGQIGYRSDEIDAITTRLNATTDPAQRTQVAQEALAILRRDMPTAPLLSPKLHIAYSPKVQGFNYHPFDFYFINHTLTLG